MGSCETCLYNKNCQFLARHKTADVVGCTAYKDATSMVELCHGHWTIETDWNYPYGKMTRICSECGHRRAFIRYEVVNYCGNCGAKMDGETEHIALEAKNER